jgi:hypothetical protein
MQIDDGLTVGIIIVKLMTFILMIVRLTIVRFEIRLENSDGELQIGNFRIMKA